MASMGVFSVLLVPEAAFGFFIRAADFDLVEFDSVGSILELLG